LLVVLVHAAVSWFMAGLIWTLHARLVASNWIRTAAWTLPGLLDLALLWLSIVR
jgi:hypothetical protein